ncbi:LysR family transcriptional regulator [Aquicoccus sp. SCR17]|nr:LysR family transcriptional regulator [Carideicomes alvinocaridis]
MDWRHMPSLTALRAFAVFAREGSMTRAGAVLNVSHAAVSQQIRGLEEHLGLTLLDRRSRVPVPTPEGTRLARALEQGFSHIIQTVEELTGADEDRPLQISTTPGFASSWLMPRLPEFRQSHPEVSLVIDPTPELRQIEPGGVDLAIRYGSGTWPGLRSELLIETPIAIVAAPSLVGEGRFSSPAELTGHHWLQELGTNESTEYLKRHGAAVDRSRGIVSLPGTLMIDAARDGQGIAVIARNFVEADIVAGRLRLLFEDNRKKGYFVVSRPDGMRPAARALRTWLLSHRQGSEGAATG